MILSSYSHPSFSSHVLLALKLIVVKIWGISISLSDWMALCQEFSHIIASPLSFYISFLHFSAQINSQTHSWAISIVKLSRGVVCACVLAGVREWPRTGLPQLSAAAAAAAEKLCIGPSNMATAVAPARLCCMQY